MTTVSLGATREFGDVALPQPLIREAHQHHRQRVGLSLALMALLLALGLTVHNAGSSRTPLAPAAIQPQSPKLLTSPLALTARSTCSLAGIVALPNPFSVIRASNTVHAFFPFSTRDGTYVAGPYNCEFITGPGPNSGVYGFSSQPSSPVEGPFLTRTRVMILAASTEGVEMHDAATARSWVVGVVSPRVHVLRALLKVPGTDVNGTFPDYTISPYSNAVKMNGGYFAFLVPTSTPGMAQGDALIFEAYAKDGSFIGTSACQFNPNQVVGSATYEVCNFQTHKFSFLSS